NDDGKIGDTAAADGNSHPFPFEICFGKLLLHICLHGFFNIVDFFPFKMLPDLHHLRKRDIVPAVNFYLYFFKDHSSILQSSFLYDFVFLSEKSAVLATVKMRQMSP